MRHKAKWATNDLIAMSERERGECIEEQEEEEEEAECRSVCERAQ